MDFIKKISIWMDKIDELDLEKKKMRREDRLGEVDYLALQKKHEEENNRQQQKYEEECTRQQQKEALGQKR